jgi:CBS domain containing-hemolysin-like protein
MILELAFSVFLLLANGFFVAAEFSLIAARRSQLEARAAAGDSRAASAVKSLSELPFMLSASQLGITLCSVLLGYMAEPTIADLLVGPFHDLGLAEAAAHTVAFVIALSLVVFLHLVFGEMVPRYLAMSGPDRAALLLAVPMRAFAAVFRPIVMALTVTARFLLSLLGIEQQDELSEARTGDEIANMLAHSRREGLLEEVEHRLMTGALRFPVRLVRSVMVPWDDVVRVPVDATAATVRDAAVHSGHSRIVVHAADSAEVLGFVHAKDLLRVDAEDEQRPVPADLVRRVLLVPADRRLQQLLLAMRRERIHVALVVDGAGHTAGVVTLEDVLEALVGDIRDEHDARMA